MNKVGDSSGFTLISPEKKNRIWHLLATKTPLIIVSSVVSVSVIVIVVIGLKSAQKYFLAKKCTTDVCTNLSQSILSTANFEADPCYNFHEYACGNFMERPEVPPGRKSWSIQEEMAEASADNLIKLMSKRLQEDSKATKKAYDYYESCVSEKSLNLTPVYQVVKAMGKWPLWKTNRRQESDSIEREDALLIAFSKQCFPFFKIRLIPLGKAYFTYLSPPDLTLTDYSHRKAWLVFFTKVADTMSKVRYWHNKRKWKMSKKASNTIMEVFLLEQHIKEVIQSGPQFPAYKGSWKMIEEFTNTFLDMEEVLPYFLKAKYKKEDNFFYEHQDYFENLEDIFGDISQDVLESYIAWTVVRCVTSDMPTHFRSGDSFFNEKLSNESLPRMMETDDGEKYIFGPEPEVSERSSRKLVCSIEVKKKFNFAIGASYAKEFLKPSDKDKVDHFCEITKNLSTRFIPRYFDKDAFDAVESMLDYLVCHAAYPRFVMNISMLDMYYEKYKTGNHYFEHNLNYRMFETSVMLSRYDNMQDPGHWEHYKVAVNAFYSRRDKMILLLPGLLRQPYFHSDAPIEMDWGSLGTVLTHELMHFIETTIEDKLKDRSKRFYEFLKKCYVRQYNRYKVLKYRVDGNISVHENMADSGGLWLGFRSLLEHYGGVDKGWEKLMEKTELDLELTRAQLFFVTFAQKFCSKYDKWNSQFHIGQSHTFNNIRLKGTLQNSKYFSKAFNCPSKSRYNPRKKCFLYDEQE